LVKRELRMSRVGKKPINIPEKTKVVYSDKLLTVQGEKGTLIRTIHPEAALEIKENTINVVMGKNDRPSRALQGLTRSLVANMVDGVTKGFERTLEINGIGYRAELKGDELVLNIGFSHPVNFSLPQGIFASVEKNTVIKLSGIDKELLGHVAAAIRRLRPPEPYKGKGIKYMEETIQKKAGKTGTK
jgi:large subunit ribosomal protein L6